MPDSSYIKPSERTLEKWEDDYFEFDELRASHAVADDIARELAEAVREVVSECDEECGSHCEKRRVLLARYDKVMGDKA